MRYFLATCEGEEEHSLTTKIKDLEKGLGSTFEEDQEFLHKYMTLTRCDLLFADKAVLIEGATERLLLPRMIEKVDAKRPEGFQLSSQYISVVEIGGAYAHRFFKLLKFLEVPTLIITDLDAVKKNCKNRLIACLVSEGTHTSNGCIKEWFDDSNIKPADLIQKSDRDKIYDIRRLAYQVSERDGEPCGRSFEEAFILANPDLFGLSENSAQEREEEACTEAKRRKKSDFALEYAIENEEWDVPRYIEEGLCWLAEGICSESAASSPSTAESAN